MVFDAYGLNYKCVFIIDFLILCRHWYHSETGSRSPTDSGSGSEDSQEKTEKICRCKL